MAPLYVSLNPLLDHSVQERPLRFDSIFGNAHPVEVEIGIGNGEYLAKIADAHADVNYVGFEEYCERISRSLRKLSRIKYNNARVMRLDVRPAFKYLFAPKSIAFIHCLFPAPWPKKSDIKHRLLKTDFLCLANSRLIDGGGMKVVTDFKPYVEWIKEQIPGSGFEVKETAIGANYGTKFERKWQEAGQKEFYELNLVKKEHAPVPFDEGITMKHYHVNTFDPNSFKMEDFSDGKCAVIFKDYLYDPKQLRAQVYVLVSDEDLVQHVRIFIVNEGKAWRICLAPGSMQMPTPGIAKALELVSLAVAKKVA